LIEESKARNERITAMEKAKTELITVEDEEEGKLYFLGKEPAIMIQIEGKKDEYYVNKKGDIYDKQGEFVGTHNAAGIINEEDFPDPKVLYQLEESKTDRKAAT